MHHRLILLHLSLIDSIGPAVITKIIAQTSNGFDLSSLYHLSTRDLQQIIGITAGQAGKLYAGLRNMKLLEYEMALISRNAISWITRIDPEYPPYLKEIHLPPTILYYQGASLETHFRSLAVVGSRAATTYAQRVIQTIVPELVAHDWTIVSGGALGADAMAHHATLKAHGKTVVVLGSGLLKPNPVSNRRLFEKVLEQGGTMLSSFPLHMDSLPQNFPARNRIIAGLSRGCLVVQAAAKSGARITAQCALDQGRDVFAVPGNIDEPLSAGCHGLIAQGAQLVTSAQDILIEYDEGEESDSKERNSSKSHQATVAHITITPKKPPFPDESPEFLILSHCNAPITTDDLLDITALDLPQLHDKLFNLQLDGYLKQNAVGLWEAVF